MESENSSNEDTSNINSLDSTHNIVRATRNSTEKKFQNLNEHNKKLSNIKGLQRKLEQKVERAKKNFRQHEKLCELENEIVSCYQML